MIEDGTHNNVRVLGAQLITSKEKGTPGVELLFKNDKNEEIRGTLWLTDKATARAVQSLRNTGWVGDDLSDLSSCGSRLCQIVVESEEYGATSYPRVKWVNENEARSGGGVGQTVMDDRAKKAFAAKMRGAVIAASGGKPAARPTAPKPQKTATEPPPIDGDDLPF